MLVTDSLVAMLRDHPDAWVGAVGANALYVPVPASVPIAGHRLLQGRWALDHVAPPDREPLAERWRRLPELGMVSLKVALVSGGKATFHVFDVVEAHGVVMVVAITEGDADLAAPAIVHDHGTASRFARILRDQAGRPFELDNAAADVIGWTAAELLDGSAPLDRVHPDDRERVLETWMATLSDPVNGHRTRARLLRRDGSHRWFEITSFNRLDDPYKPCVTTEFLDIGEEMAAHEAVREREQLVRRLAEALPLGVLQLDPEGAIVYKNDFLSGMIGEELATTMAEQFASVVDEDRALLHRAFGAAVERGSDDDVVVRMTPSGARFERLFRVITKALRAETGEATGVIACITDVTESVLMGRELERRATYDALTGCRNRAAILAHLDAAFSSGDGGLAVIFLDLDGFKAVNDRCGHAVGDEMLKAAARVIESTTRDGDHVGRLGGDEFLVVCSDVDELEAMEIATRISGELARHPAVSGADVPLRASIGVAWARRGSVSSETLVGRADAAMYTSKRSVAGAPQLWDESAAPPVSGRPAVAGLELVAPAPASPPHRRSG